MKKTNSSLIKANMERYKDSSASELWQVYGKYSANKECAMRYCKDLMNSLNGSDLRIISHNCRVFTVGFKFPDPETGVLQFAYITRDYDRYTEWH